MFGKNPALSRDGIGKNGLLLFNEQSLLAIRLFFAPERRDQALTIFIYMIGKRTVHGYHI